MHGRVDNAGGCGRLRRLSACTLSTGIAIPLWASGTSMITMLQHCTAGLLMQMLCVACQRKKWKRQKRTRPVHKAQGKWDVCFGCSHDAKSLEMETLLFPNFDS